MQKTFNWNIFFIQIVFLCFIYSIQTRSVLTISQMFYFWMNNWGNNPQVLNLKSHDVAPLHSKVTSFPWAGHALMSGTQQAMCFLFMVQTTLWEVLVSPVLFLELNPQRKSWWPNRNTICKGNNSTITLCIFGNLHQTNLMRKSWILVRFSFGLNNYGFWSSMRILFLLFFLDSRWTSRLHIWAALYSRLFVTKPCFYVWGGCPPPSIYFSSEQWL